MNWQLADGSVIPINELTNAQLTTILSDHIGRGWRPGMSARFIYQRNRWEPFEPMKVEILNVMYDLHMEIHRRPTMAETTSNVPAWANFTPTTRSRQG